VEFTGIDEFGRQCIFRLSWEDDLTLNRQLSGMVLSIQPHALVKTLRLPVHRDCHIFPGEKAAATFAG
jgi:hypothetical protein